MITHFLYCPMTGLGQHGGYRGDSWLLNRIRVLKQYTLPSITNQNNLDFVLWMSFRPEDKHNPIVIALHESLKGLRDLNFIFTFSGVCFWDDKYDEKTANQRLLKSLKGALKNLEHIVDDSDEVLMTIQPSDDMYRSKACDLFRETKTNKRFLGFTQGYIMNYATKELAEYNPDTTPPFFTIRFPAKTFLDAKKHMKWTGPYKSHEDVLKLGFHSLPGRGFVVGTHGENISTTFNHPYKGKEITGEDKERVLLSVGAYFTDPVVVRKGRRLVARQILNTLPFNERIRTIYHKLPQCFHIF